MRRFFISAAILTALAGCAAVPSTEAPDMQAPAVPAEGEFVGAPPETSPAAEPPRPRHNLSGFPLPYRQGYDDGCNSVEGKERKDMQRFAKDANYRMGWQDGYALCGQK